MRDDVYRSRRSAGLTFLATLAALLSPSCAAEMIDGEPLVESAEGALFGKTSSFWSGNPPMVPVCWEPVTFDDTALATKRQWVEDAMRENWTRYGRFNLVATGGFSTWQRCTNGQPGLHVFIAPSANECGGCNGDGDPAQHPTNGCGGLVGTQLNGMNFGVRLPRCVQNACGVGDEQTCTKRVALHEIGHALGFFHDEERSSVLECTRDNGGTQSGTTFGAFDCNTNDCSVMSGCDGVNGNTWQHRHISPGDIAAFQRAYGRRPRGQLVSTYGRCLASHGDTLNEQAFMWDCDEFEDDQEWDYTFGNRKLSVFNRSDLCLGVTSASNVPTILQCSSASNGIKWRFQNASLRSFGHCMDLANGNTNNGLVQSFRCGTVVNGIPDLEGDNPNQKWTITEGATPEIRFGGPSSNFCLTAPASGSGQLTVTTCNGSNHQKFALANADQQIVSVAFPTKCVDIASVTDAAYMAGSGLPSNGAAVQLFTCTSAQRNQKWNFSGQVANMLNAKCMQRNSEGNGSRLTTETCSSTSLLQKFDYYPL